MARREISRDSQNVRTIVGATRWLVGAPVNHREWVASGCLMIEEAASTDNFRKAGERPEKGIYFGHLIRRSLQDGSVLDYGSIELINYDDPSSMRDHVPTIPGERLEQGLALDVGGLAEMPPERLERMARNAAAVLEFYGVDPVSL